MTSEDSPSRYSSRSGGKSQKHFSYNDGPKASSDSSTTTISSTSSNTSLSSPGPSLVEHRQTTSLDREPQQKKPAPQSSQCSSTIHPPAPPIWPPYPLYPPPPPHQHLSLPHSQISQPSTESRPSFYPFYCLPAFMPPTSSATATSGPAVPQQPPNFITLSMRPMIAPWVPAYPIPSSAGSADTSPMETSNMTQKSLPMGFSPTSPDVVWMVPWIVSPSTCANYLILPLTSSQSI